jgi:peptide chain release factor 2
MLKQADDEELRELVSEELVSVEKEVNDFEIITLLSDKFDSSNAIVDIHPGAGGTESQDWAEMLYRMYTRYAESHKMKIQVVDYQVADDAGIKSVSFIVTGKNAYGLLKSERGVHRLVRISPFDSNKRRHTSFASVEVVPQINSNIDIEILDKDIRIDTYRSTGAGGQNVNKTDSAVRITHFPTGIVVTCQNERSQIQNREIAMNILKSRLYQIQVKKQQEELNKITGEQKNIEWGSQIRSYVFCPYTMVKDHRTNYEKVDVFGTLEGDLDDLIYSYLRWEVKNG